MRIVVGVSGASGSVLALEVLEQLRGADVETHLVISRGGEVTARHELGADGPERLKAAADYVHSVEDLAAPIASGSFRADAMAVVPASMRTCAALSLGLGDNLLTRAADVMLKERRRLVVLPREAPLTEAHLEAMLRLTRMGAIVAPPVPPFYAGLKTMEDVVREIAARTLMWLGVDPGENLTRWGE